MWARMVGDEALDNLAPADPAAMRSRRDLVRLHRAMGTRAIVSRAWQALLPPGPANTPLRVLEIGAGDGSLLLGVARSLARHWPPVHLTLLDRQDIVTPATLNGFAALGWAARVRVADVLEWAARPEDEALAVPQPRWDLVTASLFLHHFEADELADLLAAVAPRADRFFACEPNRAWLAWAGSHLVGALGANAVTREDAVSSVRAGFRGQEISAHWPSGGWQTREYAAGLFSHCFSACRAGAA
jgi:2-polyprenyl-3-methyl-5-hydroxy-6-metoxy-1,4-benzoquinol methylase